MAEATYNLRALYEEVFGVNLKTETQLLGGTKATVFNQVVLGTFVLPNEPMVSVSATKNVSKSSTLGGNDLNSTTIKEYMTDPSFTITIDGFLINETANAYPAIEVNRLVSLFRQKQAIQVVSPLLLTMGIHRVVIESMNLKEYEGAIHVQPYTLTCADEKDSNFDVINTLKSEVSDFVEDTIQNSATAEQFSKFIKFVS